jgi:hypothetical protein
VFSPGPEPALRGPDGSKPFPKLNLLVPRRTLGFDNTESHSSGIHLTGWGVIPSGDFESPAERFWDKSNLLSVSVEGPISLENSVGTRTWPPTSRSSYLYFPWPDATFVFVKCLTEIPNDKWNGITRGELIRWVRWPIICTPRVGVGEYRRDEKVTMRMCSTTLTQFLYHCHRPATHTPRVGCMCKLVTTLWCYTSGALCNEFLWIE